jgi:hypothetical protein
VRVGGNPPTVTATATTSAPSRVTAAVISLSTVRSSHLKKSLTGSRPPTASSMPPNPDETEIRSIVALLISFSQLLDFFGKNRVCLGMNLIGTV